MKSKNQTVMKAELKVRYKVAFKGGSHSDIHHYYPDGKNTGRAVYIDTLELAILAKEQIAEPNECMSEEDKEYWRKKSDEARIIKVIEILEDVTPTN